VRRPTHIRYMGDALATSGLEFFSKNTCDADRRYISALKLRWEAAHCGKGIATTLPAFVILHGCDMDARSAQPPTPKSATSHAATSHAAIRELPMTYEIDPPSIIIVR
jgi:hypothetical protein